MSTSTEQKGGHGGEAPIRGPRLDLWASWLSIVLWMRFESPWFLVAGGLGCIVASVGSHQTRRGASAVALLIVGVTCGFLAEEADRRYGAGWEPYWEARQIRVAERLGVEFDALVERGDAAVARLAAAAHSGSEEALEDSLAVIKSDARMAAVAVVGVDGRLSQWLGSHHGRVPDDALDGLSPYSFAETPLFSYLYFTAEIPEGGGIALVAALMRADLPAPFAAGLDDFASGFADRAGEAIRITRADRASGSEVLDFGWPDQTLLSITVLEPRRTERRERDRQRMLLVLMVLLAATWLLLVAEGRGRGATEAVAGAFVAAALMPMDQVFAVRELVDPAAFLSTLR